MIEVPHPIKPGAICRALLITSVIALCAPSAAAASVSPLPASDYQTRQVCPAPAPGYASCLAVALIPRTAAARARTHPLGMTRSAPIRVGSAAEGATEGADGLRPADLRSAYFPGEPPEAPPGAPQTIALVDAYNDPNAEADLGVYDREFGLPPCTTENKCFKKVNQLGESGHLPSAAGKREKEEASGWALEISTDIEVAHAVCQNCRILLVEARSASYANLEAAEETAVGLKVTEISNSWGGEEPMLDSPAFNNPKTVITAAAGDDGYLNWTQAEEAGEERNIGADYPASSPHVVAVGGTKLTLSETGARQSETVWNEDPSPEGGNEGAGGGGCSTQFSAPAWQLEVADWASVGCGTGAQAKRAVADVAADADPYTGVAVYDSLPYEAQGKATVLRWVPIGGTSVASPIVASMFAIAGGSHEAEYPARTLYSHLGESSLYDVTGGGNGSCNGLYSACSGSMSPLSPFDCGEAVLICNAAPGYDGPTGVGAPNGLAAFEPGSEAEHLQRLKEREAAEKKAAEELKAEEEKQQAEAAQRKLEEEARAAEARKAEEERRATEARGAEEARLAAERKLAEEAMLAGSGGGSGGNGGGGSGQEGKAGSGAGTGGSATGAGGSSSGKSSGARPNTSPGRSTVRISRLALTARASAVIARGLPTISQVAFAFTLSAPARVRVTLSRLLRVSGRLRWASAPGALTLSAAGGRNRAHLRGPHTLAPGRYRLTLAPAHGAARSIVFVLR